MSLPLPEDVIGFLRRPQPAVIGWSGQGGRPYTVATWYDWDDGEILINMDATRKRRAWLDVGAPVTLTVLDAQDWYRHVSLYGEVARTRDDVALADIDRLAHRYTGRPHRNRTAARISAWMKITSWHGWVDAGPWPSG